MRLATEIMAVVSLRNVKPGWLEDVSFVDAVDVPSCEDFLDPLAKRFITCSLASTKIASLNPPQSNPAFLQRLHVGCSPSFLYLQSAI